ncbi:MAG: 5-deoxy-glucuronate isomerase, partial [Rikenellaceae bacterium]
MKTNYELRYASNPTDFKGYDTERLRRDFLIENLFVANEVNMVYTMYDRLIIGGAMPIGEALTLDAIDPLKSSCFLSRRELGIYNVGGLGRVRIEGDTFELDYMESLYIGAGERELVFTSVDPENPAKFYFNSAPAHTSYPDKKITTNEAISVEMGSYEDANRRTINKMLVSQRVTTCQLQMGMTELLPGSV